MKILLACVHYPVASGRYLADACRRLGHDVLTVGPSTGNMIWGMQVEDKHIWQPDLADFTRTIVPDGIVLDDIVLPDGWKPDLVLVADSALTVAQRFGCPMVVYGVDNHVRNYMVGGIRFDHYFLAHSQGACLPVNGNGSQFTWLPCGYDPAAFSPSPMPMKDRKYDVCLIGILYPNRLAIVEAMREIGLNVIFGNGLFYEDYRNLYWNSRISLCASLDHDVAMRIFETGAMGCALLSDYCHDFAALGLKAGEHYFLYSTVEQAVEAAIELVKWTPARLEELAAKSLAWVAPHTWDARIQTILKVMFG